MEQHIMRSQKIKSGTKALGEKTKEARGK